MGVIATKNKDVVNWKGVHLFHHGMSSCSQRVRILLEEKKIPWESHVVDITKDEHITDWYQSINPNAVVPTMVHDGKVIIESNDILEYLDKHFDGESFLNLQGLNDERVRQCLELADNSQKDLKVLSFEYLFKPGVTRSKENLAEISKNLQNKELLSFHLEFASKEGLDTNKVQQSVNNMHACYSQLDQILSNNKWLGGESFSIADISWIPSLHRTHLMHFPISDYPNLSRWFSLIKQRPSYKKALVKYEPKWLIGFFKLYSLFRSRELKRDLCEA